MLSLLRKRFSCQGLQNDNFADFDITNLHADSFFLYFYIPDEERMPFYQVLLLFIVCFGQAPGWCQDLLDFSDPFLVDFLSK
jgi:hypothetical protein